MSQLRFSPDTPAFRRWRRTYAERTTGASACQFCLDSEHYASVQSKHPVDV